VSTASLEEQLQEQAKAAIMKLQGIDEDEPPGVSQQVFEDQLSEFKQRFGLDDRVFNELRDVMSRRVFGTTWRHFETSWRLRETRPDCFQ